MRADPKIAIIQEAMPSLGGAEKLLASVLEIYPAAPVYTLVFNRKVFAQTSFEYHPIYPSWINRLPGVSHNYKIFSPLFPLAIEQIDLRDYDLLISFSYAFAHGIIPRPNQLHICYKAAPLRYIWQGFHEFTHTRNHLMRLLMMPFLHYWRLWDLAAAQRVDEFLACSQWIAASLQRAYRRQSRVIYPPVNVERFHPISQRGDDYVIVSRLVAHKRIDLVIEAFSRLGLPLVVVGEGPERRRLQKQAVENIRFLGWQSDRAVAEILGQAKAFVYAAEEDFGIALVEAQAAGCPVIACNQGGAAEIVIAGETGLLFDHPEVEALIQAVNAFERSPHPFDAAQIRRNAERFSASRFKQEFSNQIETWWRISGL